jgi:cytochrome c peroxidase
MKNNKTVVLLFLSAVFLVLVGFQNDDPGELTSKEKLGEKLFFDPILSKDRTISCASCHKMHFKMLIQLPRFLVGVIGS